MKRALLITLTLAGGMIAARAGAEPAAGPYAAVPADAWPYVAVRELAAEGYFTGYPAGTFKSVAILALTTGAPVIPASSWREPDGSHVLHFEEPLPLIECDDPGETIRRNTRSYNAALERLLLRHPEQWIWMHRRWKLDARQVS